MANEPKISLHASHKFWVISLAIFAVLATAQIVFLTIQNRQLKQVITGQARPAPESLKPGDQVPAFKSIDADGKEKLISFEDTDCLLMITSTTCPWCAKTLPVWKDIADKAKGSPIQIVGVSLDGKGHINEYTNQNGINFEVVNFADPASQGIYKAFATPQTIFIKRGGKVAKTWQGLLTEKQEKEVTSLLLTEKGD
jgi:peroxiredoxin